MASPSPTLFSTENIRECKDAVRHLQQEELIALDSEGVQLGKDGPLTLLQIGTLDGKVYLFDVMKNGAQDRTFFEQTGLTSILTSKDIVKVIQSCSGDSAALSHQFGIRLENVFDTQVAHLVIQGHKGRKLPSRVKLAEICKLYSENADVYEGKEDVKMEWNKHVGDFWAKRPMTQEMLEYASGDVTALIPEVYETQKKYILENGLGDLFHERVHEEIEFEIDPDIKQRRKDRNMKIQNEVIQQMVTKYSLETDFTTITDEDEIRALNETTAKEMSDLSDAIKRLKNQSWNSYLKSVEEQLEDPATFNPDRGLLFKLSDIEHCGSEPLQNNAIRIKRQVVEIVTSDIQEKYTVETPLVNISKTEYQMIRGLKPLSDDEPEYPPTVVTLHWKIAEQEMKEAIENLKADPAYNMTIPVPKLKFFTNNPGVPAVVKGIAQTLMEKNESIILDRVSRKYGRNTTVEELADAERKVLERLKLSSSSYHPVVVSMHWKIVEQEVNDNIEKLNANTNYSITIPIPKLKFLANNPDVPTHVQRNAKSLLQKYESGILDQIPRKYTRDTRTEELSASEKMAIDRLKLSSSNYHPVVVSLHWKIAYERLSTDLEKYQNGTFVVNDGFRRKLTFLRNDKSVPDLVKQRAIEFLGRLPQANRGRNRRQ